MGTLISDPKLRLNPIVFPRNGQFKWAKYKKKLTKLLGYAVRHTLWPTLRIYNMFEEILLEYLDNAKIYKERADEGIETVELPLRVDDGARPFHASFLQQPIH